MLNLATIKDIQSKRAWPSVTITLPTYRTSPDNQKDAIRLKNQVKEAVERLQNEFGKRETAQVVAQIEALAETVDHEHNLDGLVIFASDEFAQLYKLPYRLPERVAIDNNFLGKRIKWLILPLHESEANRHFSGLSGWHSNLLLMHASLANSSKNPTRLNFPVIVATRS